MAREAVEMSPDRLQTLGLMAIGMVLTLVILLAIGSMI